MESGLRRCGAAATGGGAGGAGGDGALIQRPCDHRGRWSLQRPQHTHPRQFRQSRVHLLVAGGDSLTDVCVVPVNVRGDKGSV